ncbi:5'-3' exonuclease [Quadrisphaera granulorum]|uniref:5'-3' exonuclease n=1 Tax=Quadrisphaera granulorum TaxID=317664 RepID=A0A316A6U4_9ACTN|nr:5'-3' exonuclease [Quadrisphaera granulorum]PWJ53192.1 5'-3' exonuclease [Quadrisphaera granulorum]SZE97124.1 5'-3' exonuclease [Quadrisphaera granulorum]
MPDHLDGAQRTLLLDAATLYFRAFYAIPSSVKAPDGTPSGAVRGFLDMTATLVERFRPAFVVACWDDDWRPAWRVARIPSYKTHRVATSGEAEGGEEVPEYLPAQADAIAEFLEALGVPRIGAPACEADDVAGVLATRPRATGIDGIDGGIDVVSGDRDLLQLVDDDAHDGAGVRVIWIGKGVGKAEVVGGAALAEKYALPTGAGARPGDAYADLAVLRGDPSDGLPGVAGIGEKTAASLLRRHGDLLGILQAALDGDPSVTPAQRTRLAEAADYLDVAPRVVRVLRHGEVVEPFGDGDLRDGAGVAATDVPTPAPGRLDQAAVGALAERWGARSPAERLLAALTS